MVSYSRFLVIIALASVLFAAKSFAQEATTVMNQIHRAYGQRFDSNGNYIQDANMEREFVQLQENAIKTLRAQGNLGKSFQILNTVKSDLIITVTLVVEKNGQFAGILVERSQYSTLTEQSLLRLLNIPILAGGMTVFSLNGSSVAEVKSSSNFSLTQGGSIFIKYPTDYNKKTYDQVRLDITKSGTTLNFKNSAGTMFSKLKLDIWTKIFAQNFGIRGVSFQ